MSKEQKRIPDPAGKFNLISGGISKKHVRRERRKLIELLLPARDVAWAITRAAIKPSHYCGMIDHPMRTSRY